MNNQLIRMENIGIVVDSLETTIEFFTEIGLKLEGRAVIEDEWTDRVTGIVGQKVEIAMLVTPDGHSKIGLSRFIEPKVIEDNTGSPVNTLGYLRAMFKVTNIDELVKRLIGIGAELVGKVVQCEQSYRLCYIRSAEGILVGLAQPLYRA